MPLHVVHLAVEPGAQPVEKVRLILRQVDARDADARESELHPPALDVGGELGRLEGESSAHSRGLIGEGYPQHPYNGHGARAAPPRPMTRADDEGR